MSTMLRRAAMLFATLGMLVGSVILIAPAATAQDGAGLQWSASADRSGAAALDGADLPADTDLAIFLETPSTDGAARFFLNGRNVKTEWYAPFDLKGTKHDGTAALGQLSAGDYHLSATWYVNGHRTHYSADFTVSSAPACQSIAEIATSNGDFSTLVTALSVATDAGPVDFLGAVSNNDADLTVFAPTNAAFGALGAALDDVLADPSGALTDVLSYHVLGSSETGADLVAAGSATTLLGQDVAVTTDAAGNVFINNAQVLVADIEACNGIVHVIDAVLLPAAAPAPACQSIAEIATSNGDFSTLVTALSVATDAGPVDFLGAVSNNDADLTVFAPTNAAFGALGGALDDVLADPSGALTDVLSYHVLGSSESGAELVAAGSATTLLGQDVAVTTDASGNVFINNAQVVVADIEACNGIVHVIDAVLLPAAAPAPDCQNIAEIATANSDFSTLVTALSVATDAGPVDFLGVVSDNDADLTVFAPTNAAFAALGPALNDVLADPSGALTDVLLYHVLGSSETGAELVGAGSAATLLGQDVAVTTDAAGNVFINNAQVVVADIEACNGIVHVIDAVLLPAAAPVEDPIVDGNKIVLRNVDTGAYLDAERRNVSTSTDLDESNAWNLHQLHNGNWILISHSNHKILDADSRRAHYNVDTNRRLVGGTQWEIVDLGNGNYELTSVRYHRSLSDDGGNAVTSDDGQSTVWEIVPA